MSGSQEVQHSLTICFAALFDSFAHWVSKLLGSEERVEEGVPTETEPFVACPAVYRLPLKGQEREWGFYNLAELARCVSGFLLADLPSHATGGDRQAHTFDAERLLKTFGFINESMKVDRTIPGNEKKIRYMPYLCAQDKTGSQLPDDFLTSPCWIRWETIDVNPVYVVAGWGNMVIELAKAGVREVHREAVPAGVALRDCPHRAFMGTTWDGLVSVDRIVNKYYRCGKTAA